MQYIKIDDDSMESTPMLLANYMKAPKEGGLYFLYSSDFKFLYIGKTTGLKRRLSEYYNNGSHLYDVIHNVALVQYVLIEDPVERDMLETYYINKYKPPWNRSKTFTYDSNRFDKLYIGDDEPAEEEGING